MTPAAHRVRGLTIARYAQLALRAGKPALHQHRGSCGSANLPPRLFHIGSGSRRPRLLVGRNGTLSPCHQQRISVEQKHHRSYGTPLKHADNASSGTSGDHFTVSTARTPSRQAPSWQSGCQKDREPKFSKLRITQNHRRTISDLTDVRSGLGHSRRFWPNCPTSAFHPITTG